MIQKKFELEKKTMDITTDYSDFWEGTRISGLERFRTNSNLFSKLPNSSMVNDWFKQGCK